MLKITEYAPGRTTRSLATSLLVKCGLLALCLSPIDATASTTFAMENNPMPVCSPDSAPWCGRPLIHEPNPNYVNRLTPAHVALYLEIAKVGVRLLRDDLQFDEVKEMFGRQVYYDIDDKEYTFARPELKGVTFVITLADPVDGASNSVEGFDIKVTELLDGIRKNDLEAKLELQRASNYVAFSLDPRTDVDFSYEVGMDTISCYPVFINLNFFKDEAYATVTPGQTKRRNTWDRSP